MTKILIVITSWLCCGVAFGSDWPMWRADAARSAHVADSLDAELHLNWEIELPPLSPAWPASQKKLQFDSFYEPVIAGGLLLIGSNVNDSVSAFDLATGSMRWKFFTNGPVRFAPTIDNNRVYAVSDDGCLYCLKLSTGQQIWKFNGAPRANRIVGNERLVSMWPARGAAVVKDGVAYFSAGIWPSMGVFIYAVNASDGTAIWTNSTTGNRFITHPHGATSFGSISPQGYLAISDDNLIVAGGRTLPGVFDLKTGELRHFEFGGKGDGGFEVVAAGPFYVSGDEAVVTSDGTLLGNIPIDVVKEDSGIGSDGSKLVITATDGAITKKETVDKKGKKKTTIKFEPKSTKKITLQGPADIQLLAGNSLVATDKKKIAIYKYDVNAKSLEPVWGETLFSEIQRVITADGFLVVVTKDNRILGFGPTEKKPVHQKLFTLRNVVKPELLKLPREILLKADQIGGHALCLGSTSMATVNDLLTSTSLDVTCVDDDEDNIRKLRQRFYGPRPDGTGETGNFAAISADPNNAGLPPYLASIIVTEAPKDLSASTLRAVFHSLRPYGGTWCLASNDKTLAALCKKTLVDARVTQTVSKQGATNGQTTQTSDWILIERPGALAGAGVWTHQYGDSSNSVVSNDTRVKAPFGLLWFGGASNDRVLPRHGHGPSPQVAGGRLFIEGADMLRCVDVYNGRVWWERDLKGLGDYYNNTSHHPGAGDIGSNYVSLEDNVYVIHGRQLIELDAKTGKTSKEFKLDDAGGTVTWGSLAVDDDFLIVTTSPVFLPPEPPAPKADDKKKKDEKKKPAPAPKSFQAADHGSSSRLLHVFNRTTGEKLWSIESKFSFRHNAICAVNGIVYCIDGISPEQIATLKRRGIVNTASPRLSALNAATGKEIWSTEKDVFGTFLNYSREHGVLVQAGSLYRDRAKDEVGEGMIVYKGDTGAIVWKDLKLKYNGPCLLRHDKIITNGAAGFSIELLTGKTTGWKYSRMYGCNTVIGSEHLLTFRSGAAGFYDLATESGTGNLGGFRSSCTSNLVVADGVLNAPDYTRTCTCSYQLQTSLAFVHWPESEQWTFGNTDYLSATAKSYGYNFGAPGDRSDDEDVLWFEYPIIGGPSPKITIKTKPPKPQTFDRHSLLLPPGKLNWIGASGLNGVTQIEIAMPKSKKKARYTVRLMFAEPEGKLAGERVFSVSLNGEMVLKDLDIAASVANHDSTLVREFNDISIDKALKIDLKQSTKSQPVISGISIVEMP
jgi:outer membrane protein assembly factor BamB